MTLLTRSLVSLSIIALLTGGILTVDWLYGISLRDPSYFNGWLLLIFVVLLSLYNLRKKLPFLPLWDVSVWLRLHVNTGWLCIVIFLAHTEFKLPNGAFESLIWSLFVIVAGSGILGLLISQMFPARLKRKGESIIFERIPQFRRQLAEQAEALALRSINETSSASIADYYAARLRNFFNGPRNVFAHLFESNAAFVRMRGEMLSLKRYLDDRNRMILEEMLECVSTKDMLDYQYAHQLALKAWLFVHIPLTYSLLLLALVHIALVYAFSGGSL